MVSRSSLPPLRGKGSREESWSGQREPRRQVAEEWEGEAEVPCEAGRLWQVLQHLRKEASLVAQTVKNPPAMRETQLRSLGQEGPLEKEMAAHSCMLAWSIPRTEEPAGVCSLGLQSQTWLKQQRPRKGEGGPRRKMS